MENYKNEDIGKYDDGLARGLFSACEKDYITATSLLNFLYFTKRKPDYLLELSKTSDVFKAKFLRIKKTYDEFDGDLPEFVSVDYKYDLTLDLDDYKIEFLIAKQKHNGFQPAFFSFLKISFVKLAPFSKPASFTITMKDFVHDEFDEYGFETRYDCLTQWFFDSIAGKLGDFENYEEVISLHAASQFKKIITADNKASKIDPKVSLNFARMIKDHVDRFSKIC